MIKIIKSGIQCSVQDMGRKGYRNVGMPVSGWMDAKSALAANILLDNDANDAMIEMGPVGIEIIFLENTIIALTGAPKMTLLNKKQLPFNKRINVKTGDILKCRTGSQGVWTYLSIKNGIRTEKIWSSRSQYLPVGIGPAFEKGATLPIHIFEGHYNSAHFSKLKIGSHLEKERIRVLKGPEYHFLSSEQKEFILNTAFLIGKNSNRMGYFLESEQSALLEGVSEIITSVVSPGTVQLPPSGVPVVLMKDCQTTGGYARVLQISSDDLSAMAQRRAGSKVYLNFQEQ